MRATLSCLVINLVASIAPEPQLTDAKPQLARRVRGRRRNRDDGRRPALHARTRAPLVRSGALHCRAVTLRVFQGYFEFGSGRERAWRARRCADLVSSSLDEFEQ